MSKKKVDVEKLRDKNISMKDLFWSVLKEHKKPSELTKTEINALIIRIGYLDNKEREFYKEVLIRDNMPISEFEKYTKLGLMDKYFKEKVKVLQ